MKNIIVYLSFAAICMPELLVFQESAFWSVIGMVYAVMLWFAPKWCKPFRTLYLKFYGMNYKFIRNLEK